jgi:hypothetical protein
MVSTAEMFASVVVSVVALLAPLLAVAMVIALCWVSVLLVRRFLLNSKARK